MVFIFLFIQDLDLAPLLPYINSVQEDAGDDDDEDLELITPPNPDLKGSASKHYNKVSTVHTTA